MGAAIPPASASPCSLGPAPDPRCGRFLATPGLVGGRGRRHCLRCCKQDHLFGGDGTGKMERFSFSYLEPASRVALSADRRLCFVPRYWRDARRLQHRWAKWLRRQLGGGAGVACCARQRLGRRGAFRGHGATVFHLARGRTCDPADVRSDRQRHRRVSGHTRRPGAARGRKRSGAMRPRAIES